MRPHRSRLARRAVLLLCASGLAVAGPLAIRRAEAKRGKKGRPAGSGAGEGADHEAREAAAEFDKLGKAAYRKKEWDDAIAAFEGAYEADPAPKFLFNLARSFEKKGDLGRAAHYFERYLEAAPEAKDKRKVKALARMLKLKLKRRFSRVEVTSKPAGAFVRVTLEKGEPVEGVTPFSGWLPFGRHRLEVQKEGHEIAEQLLLVKPGTTETVALELRAEAGVTPEPAARAEVGPAPAEGGEGAAAPVAEAAAAAEPGGGGEEVAAAPEPPAVEPGPGSGTGWFPWATMGLGAALLGGGAVFGRLSAAEEEARDSVAGDARADDNRASYDDWEAHDEAARSRALVANVLYGAGGVAVVAGIVVLLVGGEEPGEASVTAVPVLGPNVAGAAIVWRPGP